MGLSVYSVYEDLRTYEKLSNNNFKISFELLAGFALLCEYIRYNSIRDIIAYKLRA